MSTTKGTETKERYALDHQAGPVYGFRPISDMEDARLAKQRDTPQIIEVLVWPYPESTDQRPALRRYFALNLPQAVVRAAEIEIRLREQELRAALVALRPATSKETNTFFRVMDILEAQMPVLDANQVKESIGLLRTLMCGVSVGKNLGERFERVDSNTYTEGSVSSMAPGRTGERKAEAETNNPM